MIFIVDDEPLIRDTLRLILQNERYPVSAFGSAAAALRAARECCPHVLLTDIGMPEMDGFELASQVRAKFPKCKIILMSGHFRGTPAASRFAGEWTFLAKPFSPSAMLKLMQRLYGLEGAPPAAETRLEVH